MITISVCMIVKDEELSLARCLDGIKDIADEIIIVDTGSCDLTKSIAYGYTDRVYDFKWVHDFSIARNFSFSKAACDYIMWLDADDVLTRENARLFLDLKRTLSGEIDVVMMKYHVSNDEHQCLSFTYFRERLLKREKNFRWVGEVHEVIVPTGNIYYSEITIHHKKIKKPDGSRNLFIYETLLDSGKTLDTRQKYYYARELLQNKRYARATDMFYEFLSCQDAHVENILSACRDLYVCLYHLNEREKALDALYMCFKYSHPRAEICCDLGNHYFEKNLLISAVFWYRAALLCKGDLKSGGFVMEDCYNFIPYIRLFECYYKIGDYELARECNEHAGTVKPNDRIYLYNKKRLEKKEREVRGETPKKETDAKNN